MTDEEVVRAAVAAWNAGGSAAAARFLGEEVVLEDPPQMPDREQWIGRDAAARRLDEVSGGRWAEIRDLRSAGDSILVSLDLRGGPMPDSPQLAMIYLLIRVDRSAISALQVFHDEDSLSEATPDYRSRRSGPRQSRVLPWR